MTPIKIHFDKPHTATCVYKAVMFAIFKMAKPIPEQFVFDQDQENPFVSYESFEDCYKRCKKIQEDKESSGFLQSHEIRGQSQRLWQNQSPISKGSEKWAEQLDMNTGNLSSTLIKVI